MTSPNPVISGLLSQIQQYKQKYYLNKLLKGIILSAGLLLTAFLFVNTLEYYGRFNSVVRGALLFSFLGALAFSFFNWVVLPLFHLWGLKKPLSDEAAALQIGEHFPAIGDKLLNTIQLSHISGKQSDLISASIQQKSAQLLIVKFSDAVKLDENKKWLKYAIYPLGAVAVILLFNPSFFTSSSDRIIHFQNNYTFAPFTFEIDNKNLKAFKNEDFDLNLKLKGNTIPKTVYLIQNGSRFKLEKVNDVQYQYVFKNLQRNIAFSFEAAGFQSDVHEIQVIERPALLSFDVLLQYPAYLNKPAESLNNVGNVTVPEGTSIQWNFNTNATNALGIKMDEDSVQYIAKRQENKAFQIKKVVRKSSQYEIVLKNDQATNSEKIGYTINVIPDKYPLLSLENFQDTTLYNYLVLGGTISDDYGFSQLRLNYSITRNGQSEAVAGKSIPISFNKTVNTQSFYFQWFTDSLKLVPGDKIEYYAQVWDNDGINGPKSVRSRSVQYTIPSKDAIEADIKKSEKQTENEIQSAIKNAQSLQKDLKNLDERLKSTKDVDFKEQKLIEDILKKREQLMEQLERIQEKNQNTTDKSKQFNQQSPEIQDKMQQLQKLMQELMDKDTEKLYEELKKMLEKNQSERLNSAMEKLRNKERNLEKELERTMKLFKQMQLEQKMENLVEKLDNLSEKQNDLADKTNEKQADTKELQKEEQEIEKQFEKAQEELKEAEELSKEIEQPVETPKEEQKEAKEQINESQKQLNKQDRSKAAEAMKKASKAMKESASSLSDAMKSAEMEQMEENLDALRDILENLITLSFDQESVMNDFRGVNLQDPRFVKLGQQQLKLKDDAKVVEDSLYALANRMLQIQSFVTRELNDMNGYMDASMQNIKDRHLNVATAKQQSAMTSMNNLALMLGDVLNQMQQQMAMAMPGAGKKKKGNQKGESPGIGEMQEKLNGQIKELGSGKEGQGNQSEKLARMAAEQAKIRKMIQDLIESQKGTTIGNQLNKELQEIADQMDKGETDLVNKRINPELQKRNEKIQTRLLEAEKAMKEQDEEEQRKANAAKEVPRKPPVAFEKYIKEKEKQTELLRTIPPSLSPFYKQEVDTYFKKSNLNN